MKNLRIQTEIISAANCKVDVTLTFDIMTSIGKAECKVEHANSISPQLYITAYTVYQPLPRYADTGNTMALAEARKRIDSDVIQICNNNNWTFHGPI